MNQFTEQQLEEGDRKHDEIRDAKVEKEQKLRIPTPRTDEEWASWPYAGPGISVHFGRELERELTAARAELEKLSEQNRLFRNETLICADCDAVRKEEYDRAIEQRDGLVEAIRAYLKMETSDIALQTALQSLTTNAKSPSVGATDKNHE